MPAATVGLYVPSRHSNPDLERMDGLPARFTGLADRFALPPG